MEPRVKRLLLFFVAGMVALFALAFGVSQAEAANGDRVPFELVKTQSPGIWNSGGGSYGSTLFDGAISTGYYNIYSMLNTEFPVNISMPYHDALWFRRTDNRNTNLNQIHIYVDIPAGVKGSVSIHVPTTQGNGAEDNILQSKTFNGPRTGWEYVSGFTVFDQPTWTVSIRLNCVGDYGLECGDGVKAHIKEVRFFEGQSVAWPTTPGHTENDPEPSPDPTPIYIQPPPVYVEPTTEYTGNPNVLIAPYGVTWDGTYVRVVGGSDVSIYYSFPADSLFTERLACSALEIGDDCLISEDQHPGQVLLVRATGAGDQHDSFRVILAVHIEFGRYTMAIFRQMRDLLIEIRDILAAMFALNTEGLGYTQVSDAIDNLSTAGVFGDVQQAGDLMAGVISDATASEPSNTPTNYRTNYDLITDMGIPCESGDLAKLTFCFPMSYGMEGVPGGVQTSYLRLDIPNHVRAHSEGYQNLWDVIRTMIYIGFAFWLFRQFVPQFQV